MSLMDNWTKEIDEGLHEKIEEQISQIGLRLTTTKIDFRGV